MSSTAKRRRNNKKGLITTIKENKGKAIIILIVAVIIFAYARSIVTLKIENARLRQQQKNLTEERKEIQEKLKNVDNVTYIEEQARKQLQLMYPDEIYFKFEEGENAKQKPSKQKN